MAAKTLAEAFLREHPELRSFLLVDARSTGTTLGSGSYGSVEEVAVPGAVCAAKKIHSLFQDATKVAPEWIEKTSAEFVRECLLMSTLRHPHIVQFLGVCFLPGSPIPALVMEKLLTSLHDVLDPEPPPPTKAYIPLSLKRSVLLDVANGLAFLHSHRPPIIHRDLSAKNILLNAGMTAKIADLGMARIVPALKAATMTKAPGASIYMPPEAMEDESKYDVTIDIFSLGVVAIFLLSQTFPKPLAAAYMNEKGVMVGRTELERRDNYTQQILSQLREAHPLVKMIQRCLKNRIHERPTIQNVVSLLTQARGEIDDKEYDVNKLELVRQLLLLKLRDEQIEPQQQLITLQKKSNRALKEQIGVQRARTKSLETQIDSLQAEVAAFKRDHKVRAKSLDVQNESLEDGKISVQRIRAKSLEEQNESLQDGKTGIPAAVTPHKSGAGAATARVRPPIPAARNEAQWPVSLHWRRGKDIPADKLLWASSVTINGMIYCGGNDPHSRDVVQYNPGSGGWRKLRKSPTAGFALTSLNGQLVLAGGDAKNRVWDSAHSEWTHPFPSMPSGHEIPAAVGYQKYLIVACGILHTDAVEVMDSSSGRWYSAQPVPAGGHRMSSVVVGDYWYLSSFGGWGDKNEHIFWAHLPTLTSSAASTDTGTASIWHELPTPPVEGYTLLAFQGHLLLVGGRGCKQEIHCYEPETSQWREFGRLPVGMHVPCCAVLPSGDLMVAGGMTRDTKDFSKRMWIGSIGN